MSKAPEQGPASFADLPLRQRKRARTRAALVAALLERLVERPLEDVAIHELAEAAEISQGTFFNYFATKEGLLTFFVRLWSLDVALVARRVEAQHTSALAAIEALFVFTAQQSRAHPRLMSEIIRHQARGLATSEVPDLEAGDRLLRLDDHPEALSLPGGGLDQLLPWLLGLALERGELPPEAPLPLMTLTLASIFFGAPLLLAGRDPRAIEETYRAQLQLLWRGVGATATSREEWTP